MRNATLDRREWMATAAAATAACSLPISSATAKPAPTAIGLGFSLYGARSLSLEKAIAACRKIGYDGVEIPVTAGWPGDSQNFSPQRAASVAGALRDNQLRLSGLMENLPLLGNDTHLRKNLERLAQAAEVGHLLGEDLPVVETILGGRPQNWRKERTAMARALEAWGELAAKHKFQIAIKAHVGGAMHLPEHPVELVQEVGNPFLKCAYDYSHFQLRNVDLTESLNTLLPHTVFIHVKDARGDASRVQFLLPGEGSIDYQKYLKHVNRTKYRGDLVVEVSGQIHSRKGYDPIAAAQKSYAFLSQAFAEAGVRRPSP